MNFSETECSFPVDRKKHWNYWTIAKKFYKENQKKIIKSCNWIGLIQLCEVLLFEKQCKDLKSAYCKWNKNTMNLFIIKDKAEWIFSSSFYF